MSRRNRHSDPQSQVATAPAPELTYREPAWLRPVLVALAALLLLGLFATEIADYDTWWHLKTGEYIARTHTLPVPDPFSYTSSLGKPAYPGEEQVRRFNLTHEWLAQVILYGIYSMGGAPALVIFKAMLLGALCFLAGLVAARRSGSFYAGLAAALAAALIAMEFSSDRPALISFLMVAVFVTLLEFKRALWLIPALALLWANCHGGFFLGWIVLAAYSVEAAILLFRKQAAGYAARLWKVSAAAIAITFFNPNGFQVIATLFRYRQSFLTSTLVEWRAPYLWGPPYSFDLLLYGAAIALLLSWRKVHASDWFLFAAFAAASLTAYRNILLIGFLAPILIAAWFPKRWRAPRFLGFGMAILLVGAIAAGLSTGRFYQLRVAEWEYPSGAADFIRSHGISKPMFNTYEYGGYLIWRLWPLERVFIDGRALNESVYRDYQQILYDRGSAPNVLGAQCRNLLDRYAIRVVVMNTFEYVTGAFYPLALALGSPNTEEWKLVYQDKQSLVFYRDPPVVLPVLDKARLTIDHMEAECALHIEHEPAYPLCARSLADLSLRAQDYERAKRMLGLYLSNSAEKDPSAQQALRRLMSR